ncbi:MAG: hypothetical protein Q7R97_01965 [Candidatus Daviesbacteria bacterium]|nr:hypothetical protein [Candidatus Daviesbacteria bacterium]
MKILIALIIIGIITVGVWDLRDGSFDTFSLLSVNKYGSFLSQVNVKDLPFKVLTPSYIPSDFKFLKEDSVKIVQGNIGIPQVNYLFETSDGKNGIALRQMDKVRYQEKISEKQNMENFQTIEQNGKIIYIKIPVNQVRSIFGDLQYIASLRTTNDDSFIELNYSGTTPPSKEELIKILLSFK